MSYSAAKRRFIGISLFREIKRISHMYVHMTLYRWSKNQPNLEEDGVEYKLPLGGEGEEIVNPLN